MALNTDRVGDTGHLLSTLAQAGLRRQTAETLKAGVQLGGWSADQLAALPTELARTRVLDDVRRGLEGEKRQQAAWAQGIGSPGNPFTDSLVSPFNPPSTNFKNRIALSLVTQQQVADNLAVMHQALDRPLGYFDPETGVLQSSVPDRRASPAAAAESLSWFENFYFMFAGDPSAGSVADTVPHTIVKTQTNLDHARLAAALEWHQRRDGQYPASLEAVAGFFPNGLPPDPSTGEPYRYERSTDGSYRLWGRGIDRTDNAADAKKDVVWTGGVKLLETADPSAVSPIPWKTCRQMFPKPGRASCERRSCSWAFSSGLSSSSAPLISGFAEEAG